MKRIIATIAAVLCFLAAVGIMVYPAVSSYVNEKYRSEIQTVYEEQVQQKDDTVIREAWNQAVAYNKAITPGAMESDAYSKEAIQAASQDYDAMLNITGNGIMGYVEISKIDVYLPIFHGTGSDSLERGVGHLVGSSLPVGGESTHTVLTGHSGMASQRMFTDLGQLQPGDVFYLHVLNEVLAYQVDEINTVLPYDTSLLGIYPTEDLCTLVTCTPIGVNTHRLLVRGHRIEYEVAVEVQEGITVQQEEIKSSWQEQYYLGLLFGILALLLIALVTVVTILIRRLCRKKHRNGGRYLRKKAAKRILTLLLIAVFLAGLYVALYPICRGILVDRGMKQTAKSFREWVETVPTAPAVSAVPTVTAPTVQETSEPQFGETAPQETEPAKTRPYQQLWEDMSSYNATIYEAGQTGLTDESAYEEPSFTLEDYGLDSEIFGVISIPSLDIEMPIYLGAGYQHMADGAAHLTQTSLPIGGSNTNCVIAGHRGWRGAAYFLYLTDLKEGDEVLVTNLWETLRYRVVEIQIIDPNDVDAILIQEGRELLTLLTCYRVASGEKLRYLVFCERIHGNAD